MVKIYLSPSNQPNNRYCVGNTNEKVQMEIVAQKIKAILDKEYECQTVMATLSMGIGANERPLEAKNQVCNVYLAIHSNAGGGGKASGAVVLYHPNQAMGKTLASNIVKELNAICPIKSNRSSSVENGMNSFSGVGYGEVRNPTNFGIITVLSETDFHDTVNTAEWIISSKDIIARAYVNALVKTFNIPKKVVPAPPTQPPSDKLYCVQVGAYSIKSNAEAMLEKLKLAGFKDAFIKVE